MALKVSIIVHTSGKEESTSESVTMTSSANNPILWYLPATEMPFIVGELLMAAAKGYITNVNIKGVRGQPCLVPFVILMALESTEEVKTCADRFVFNAKMAERMKPAKPNFVRVACKYPPCTLSKAFSASRATKAVGSLRLSAIRSRLRILRVPSGA